MTLILNGTDNSAATPAVTGTDTDTGVYYPAANQVALATNGAQAMLVNATQGVQFNYGISVGGTAPSTDGTGVKFPATQVSASDANTLDDYEEGTYTPTDASGAGLTFAGSSGATYVKIGKFVTVNIVVTYPSTSSTSLARISLPFTTSSGVGFSAQAAGSVLKNTGAVSISYVSQGQNSVEFYPPNSFTAQTNANFSGASVIATISYLTAN
jgi:hypothetical protein